MVPNDAQCARIGEVIPTITMYLCIWWLLNNTVVSVTIMFSVLRDNFEPSFVR